MDIPEKFYDAVHQLYETYGETFHEQVVSFDRQLHLSIGNNRYRSALFHILIGSTPDYRVDRIDLDGEHSVQAFVNRAQVMRQISSHPHACLLTV